MFQAWQSMALWKRVLVGLVIGLVIGIALHYGLPKTENADGVTGADIADTYIYPFGDAFVRLIKMLVIPLIATTLVAGITAMGDPKKLGSLGIRTLSLYLLTTFFAVSMGLALGPLSSRVLASNILTQVTNPRRRLKEKWRLLAIGQLSISC